MSGGWFVEYFGLFINWFWYEFVDWFDVYYGLFV